MTVRIIEDDNVVTEADKVCAACTISRNYSRKTNRHSYEYTRLELAILMFMVKSYLSSPKNFVTNDANASDRMNAANIIVSYLSDADVKRELRKAVSFYLPTRIGYFANNLVDTFITITAK